MKIGMGQIINHTYGMYMCYPIGDITIYNVHQACQCVKWRSFRKSCVRVYHIYKDVWNAALGEELQNISRV